MVSAADERERGHGSRGTTIAIAAIAYFVVAAWVPLGGTLLYPLTLFTTWVHEMGHGLTALALGGSFHELEIHKDAGGLARAWAGSGWPQAAVCAGGMLAPPLFGSIILAVVHGPRRAQWFLGGLAAAIVLSLVLYVRSATGMVAMGLVAGGLVIVAWRFRAAPYRRVVIAQVLAVILAVDTLTRMVHYAFMSEARAGAASDVSQIADNLGGHYLLWGLAIVVIALALLAGGLWWSLRAPRATRSPR